MNKIHTASARGVDLSVLIISLEIIFPQSHSHLQFSSHTHSLLLMHNVKNNFKEKIKKNL